LSFAGTVSIENGEVESIEYSLNGGSGWTVIPTDQNRFVFVTPALVEGNYTVLARAKSKTGVMINCQNFGRNKLRPVNCQILDPKIIKEIRVNK